MLQEMLSYKPYVEVLDSIRRLRQMGYKTALLTNNMYSAGQPLQPLDESLFDVVRIRARIAELLG
jgi:FMN phosphatase YigB (HAD superfamily)